MIRQVVVLDDAAHDIEAAIDFYEASKMGSVFTFAIRLSLI